VVAYVAPMLLGAGLACVGDLGISTIADALHLQLLDVATLGTGRDANVRLTMAPAPSQDPRRPIHPEQHEREED
jgi:diaminohydroxyphosphoribosylaminopyrimidine deaminase/5-amino-6-(5-phosphoribosylamino)uracil reductase